MLASLGTGKVSGNRLLLANGAAETPLHQALDRALRTSRPTSVLLVGLSQMHAPGPRVHHRRACRSIMDLAARSHAGQAFSCPNGDLVLLAAADVVAEVAGTLADMLHAEMAGVELLSTWVMPRDDDAVRARLGGMASEPPGPPEDQPAPIGAIAAVGALLASAPGGEMIRRQTCVRITGGAMAPLFQEVSFSLAALEARIGLRLPAGADPYLFRHLARQIDEQMLAALARERLSIGSSLHLNLALPSLETAGWRRLLAAAGQSRVRLGIELQLLEVVADLPGFARGRDELRAHGCHVVLDGVDGAAMLLAAPDRLGVDGLKLEWSPRLALLSEAERRVLLRSFERLGPDRVVLHRTETEAALAWGMAAGLRSFQGHYVDTMLAAARRSACGYAAGCTLRHCGDRAGATDAAGRVGCLDLALLDGSQEGGGGSPFASRGMAA